MKSRFNIGDRVTDARQHTIKGINVSDLGLVEYKLDDQLFINEGCLLPADEAVMIAIAEIEEQETVRAAYITRNIFSLYCAKELKKELDDAGLKYKIRVASIIFIDEE